jgi:hypothetical protein
MPEKKENFTNFINFDTIFSAYYFLKVYLHQFSKIKVEKSHKIVGIKVSYYFCRMIEGSGSRAGSIPLTSGSGSGRPKNMWIRWIRIRIRNTAHEKNTGDIL